MPGPKRTRPGARVRPDRTIKALPPPNSPFPGCCKPYPFARFVNQKLVELNYHHIGQQCRGYIEPINMEGWNADVDTRNARRGAGRNER